LVVFEDVCKTYDGVTHAVDQRTLPRQMFAGINDNISLTITAAGTLLVLLACLLLLTMEWLRRRGERLRARIG
jgi:putative spermidine/putrescine transport system permease protein